LDEFTEQNEFVSHWSSSNVELSLQSEADFLVPEGISVEFKQGKPLLLNSSGELSLHVFMENTGQVLTMILPVERRGGQSSVLSILLTLLFYCIVIVVLLMWLYPLIKRLMVMQKTAKKLGRGELTARIKPSKLSYISEIEDEFNRMAGQIQRLVDDNKLLSRAVSHNLKTPITRLRMGMDVLEEATDPLDVDRYIVRINKDLDEMQALVETLLHYSSLDELNVTLNTESVDLGVFAQELFSSSSASDVSVKIYSSDGDVNVKVDPRYLAMQLNNVMTNALNHAEELVLVEVKSTKDMHNNPVVAFTIEDDGKGIGQADIENVVKPFWRGGNNQGIKGHGMGLAIVARIADWLNAELIIGKSETLGGAKLRLLYAKN